MPAKAATPWRGLAFGLGIDSDFELPGLRRDGADDGSPGRRIRIERGEAPAVPEAGWGERVEEWRYPTGLLGVAIDFAADRGYRFFVHDAGVYELSADVATVTCRPIPGSEWRWRRYLIGQVLPFAALLQGIEVFHASGVTFGDAAVAIVGGTGMGKSTLALNMHLLGAGFLTDDVVAAEQRGSEIVAHPGIPAAKVRRLARDLLVPDDRGILGRPVSEDEQEIRYEVEAAPAALGLGAVCILEPAGGEDAVEVEETRAEAGQLLGNTFNLLVQDEERLRRQLDVCASIAAQARFLRVGIGKRPGPKAAGRLAGRLGEMLSSAGS
jgi:hypothetical protein